MWIFCFRIGPARLDVQCAHLCHNACVRLMIYFPLSAVLQRLVSGAAHFEGALQQAISSNPLVGGVVWPMHEWRQTEDFILFALHVIKEPVVSSW
eukprot:s1985_g6.t1